MPSVGAHDVKIISHHLVALVEVKSEPTELIALMLDAGLSDNYEIEQ